jgi:hypothetical protein
MNSSAFRYHDMSRIAPGAAPSELVVAGRFTLTLRQHDVKPDPPS